MAWRQFTTDLHTDLIEAGPTDDGNWEDGLLKLPLPAGADLPEPGDGFEMDNGDGVWIGEVARADATTRTALLDLT